MTEQIKNLVNNTSTVEDFWNKHSDDHVVKEQGFDFTKLGDKEKNILTEFIYIKDKIVEYLNDDTIAGLSDVVTDFEDKYWNPYKSDKNSKLVFQHLLGNLISRLKAPLQILEDNINNEGIDKKGLIERIKSI